MWLFTFENQKKKSTFLLFFVAMCHHNEDICYIAQSQDTSLPLSSLICCIGVESYWWGKLLDH